MWQLVFRCSLCFLLGALAVSMCLTVPCGCRRQAPAETSVATQPVGSPVPEGGDPGERVELDLETAQCRGGTATITMEVVPTILPADISLVTLFVPAKARGVEPEKVFAETQLQVLVGFPDTSTAAATTIMQDGEFRGQLTVWQRAGDIVRDGEIRLQLKGNSMLKYEGAGRLYVWFADATKVRVSDRRDTKLDFGSTD